MIEQHADIKGFFRERIVAALKDQDVSADERIEFYLVNLLSKFALIPGEQVWACSLVQLLTEASEAQGVERLKKYRALGDLSLLVSGFFWEHLERKGVNRTYAMTVGCGAYTQAGSMASVVGGTTEFALADVFAGLAEGFERYASVLDDVREATELKTPQQIVKLYERWRKSSSPKLAARLNEAGVFPQRDGGVAIH